MSSDPTGAVQVTAGLTVTVSPSWRARLAEVGGDLGAAVVAAWSGSSRCGSVVSSPAFEGGVGEDLRGMAPAAAGEVLHAAVLDVADRLSAALEPRVFGPGGPVTVTVTGGAVIGVVFDPHWSATATAEALGRAATAALRAVPVGRGDDAVLAEAVRLGADPVALMRVVR